MQATNYQNLKEIYSSERNRIYRAVEPETGRNIILKVAAGADQSGLFNEAEIARGLAEIYPIVSLERLDGAPVLVRNYVEGVPLRQLIDEEGMPLDIFFSLVFPAIEAVQHLHDARTLHLDINPSNLIVDTRTNQVHLIDFEQSARLESRELSLSSLHELEGDLRYMAPERTGRMNRRVEYRSDYYSLGVIFYEMLCGAPPFEQEDPLGLVHSHLAIVPASPSTRRRDVPGMLSKVILKLLGKNAEDRYQSLIGLRTDLHRCRQSWQANGSIEEFAPGQSDRFGKLNICQKLYGREKELSAMKDAFNLAARGDKVLCLLGGFSGVGKSALAQELYRPVTAKDGLFLWGKFDAIQRSTPFYAWRQAFDQFAEWLLVEPPEVLHHWRDKILRRLSGLGSVMVDLAPRLGLILGEQPELAPLSARDNQQRIQFAINAFIAALAESEHPLVFFLDDWQWADEASVQLLESIFVNDNLGCLMLIAAYRSNEISGVESFGSAARHIKAYINMGSITNGYVLEQELTPLSLRDMVHLLKDTLHGDDQRVMPLAEILLSKTHGNAFATVNLLQVLYEEQLLTYDLEKNQWDWDAHRIKRKNISADVADWLVSRLRRLPRDTIRNLQIAAASGAEFQLDEVARICGVSSSDAHRALWHSIRDGFVEPLDSQYKFLPDYYEEKGINLAFRFIHDRVQQAVYQMIPARDREWFHFETGRLMLPLLREPGRRHVLFDVAQHFAHGFTHVQGSGFEQEVGRLLVETGVRAYQSATFDVAYSYLQKTLDIEPPVITERSERLSIYAKLIEAAYMLDREEEMVDWVQKALDSTLDPLERVPIEEACIHCLIAASKFEETKKVVRESLKSFGVKIPAKGSQLQVIYQAIRTGLLLPVSKMDKISDFPLMTDPEKLAAMRLLAIAAPAFHLTDMNTYALVILKMVNLSLRYGNCPESVQAYSSYGIILTAAMNKPREGYLIGKQSLQLLEKLEAVSMEPIAYFVDGAFISHIEEPLSASVASLRKGYQAAIRNGNLDYATWCLYFINFTHYYRGHALPEWMRDINRSLQLKRQYRQFNQLDKELTLREYGRRLIALDDNPGLWKDDQFDEEELLERVEASKDVISAFRLYSDKGMTLLWYERYDDAWIAFSQGDRYLKDAAGTLAVPHFLLYQTLAGINSSFFVESKVRKKIRKNRKQLAAMQRISSGNYRYATALIDAELAGARRASDARALYEEAIGLASEGGFIAAVAYGRRSLGSYLQETGGREAKKALRTACLTFRELGMTAIEELTRRVYLPESDLAVQGGKRVGRHLGTEITDLDAITLIKTTQALTSEIRLDRLIEKLMLYAMENAGAQKGWFIIRRAQDWFVELGMNAVDMKGVFQRTPLSGCGLLAETAVNYAAKTKEPLVVEDAAHTHPFREDEFVQRHQVKSILCIPFIHQSRIAGFIYLENDLISGAFTRERIEFLTLLTSQLGVTIENAMLYERMEQQVEERTRKWQEEKQKSDQLLLNILPAEVAEELKQKGEARARRYDHVTVLFADIENFSRLAEEISAESVVEELHLCFKAFDEIVERHGLEKIKTIGDAYLCVAGLPVQMDDHALRSVRVAQEMQRWITAENGRRREAGRDYFRIRIGIHSGPVVAGIVGIRKFAYDIWGNTVNVAARMEENSEPGRINISESTYERVRDQVNCIYRGEVEGKNIGAMKMYFVEE